MPERLLESLMNGGIDLCGHDGAGESQPRIDLRPLYEERFVVAFPSGHRLEALEEVPLMEISGGPYLARANCEYYQAFENIIAQQHLTLDDVYRSEREDWIQTMIMAGMGIAFMPEFSPILPGLQTRLIVEPEVRRKICLATVAGRRFSPAVAASSNPSMLQGGRAE